MYTSKLEIYIFRLEIKLSSGFEHLFIRIRKLFQRLRELFPKDWPVNPETMRIFVHKSNKRKTMRATISLDSLWAIIQSLSFNNRKWLSDKLQESLREEETEYISKEEILAGIDAGLKDLKLIREGKLDVMSAEEFLEELEDY